MDKKAMLMQLIQQYEDGNKTRFAKRLGLSPQGISTWLSRGTIDYELIYSKCEYLSATWLLTGEGSMLRTEQAQPAPQPTVQPITQDSLSGEVAYIYKMYEKKDEENKVLYKENADLREEIGNLKAQVGTQKEPQAPDHPPLAFDGGFIESFTETPSGGSTKDYVHMRKPTTIKKSSTSKT